MNRFQKLAVSTATATILLFAVGGLVRGTGSGLGCSGWPKCGPGRWLPYLTLHSIIEYSHRGLVVIVTVLVVAVAVAALRYRTIPRIFRPAMAAPPLVIGQAVLGGIVVRTDLNPWWVTAHFLVALAFVADVVVLATNSFCAVKLPAERPAVRGADPAFARLSMRASAAVGALLLVGTYVSSAIHPVKAGSPTWATSKSSTQSPSSPTRTFLGE